MEKILVIDDDEGVCYSLARLLANDERSVTAVQTPEAGLEAMRGEDPELVLLDVKIPGADGLELLRRIRKQRPRQLVLMMTAHGTTETAIEAMKRGAFDYLMKPFDSEALIAAVNKALDTARLNRQVTADVEDAAQQTGAGAKTPDRIIGKSPAMQSVYKKIGQAAPRDVPVLIRGESGTGKELAARALWQHSKRAAQPFLAVNCAAIPETLLEGELFGHERGSFTGAASRKLGKFEQADGGTLFLDEVGDMTLATQAKILRVLQSNTFERVGGAETIKVDVRLLAATHQHLEKLIRDGKFREDLYYRLRVMEITLPPLRERRADIPDICHYLVRRHREACASEASGFSPQALEALTAWDWPGNIRQLENVIRRAMVVCTGQIINTSDLDYGPETARPGAAGGGTAQPLGSHAPAANGRGQWHQAGVSHDMDALVECLLASGQERLIEELERQLIGRALEKLNGNQLQTAKLLGITRNTLRSRIEKYGLRPKVKVV